MDPVARALLDRYPQPTSAGTANNYRRVGDESVDQDQFSLRLDHRFPANRDQVFGRLTRFREEFLPVTPFPDGSGVTTGTLGPQDTTSSSFASSYQRTFSSDVLNELRIGDTRRRVVRTAAELGGTASTSLGLPGIPSNARFPNTLPTFLIAGYQQLGSPPNTASEFSTSVTQIADSLTWLKGRHTFKLGGDLRWERLNVLQPPSPTGSFTFSSLFSDLPGIANTGTPLASFLLGQVQQFSIDLQQEEIRNRAHFEEYFVQDDWRLSDRVTLNGGVRYTLNFPSTEENNQVAVFNLETQQLEYLGRDGQPRAARQLHKLNFGPRLGMVGRITDRTVARTGYGMVWIEMAGITTPFTTPVFPFLQTVSQRTLDNITPAFSARRRAQRPADSADAECRCRAGRVCRRSRPGFRLRPAVEYVGSAGTDRGHLRRGRLHGIEDHPRRPARYEPEPADRRSARAGRVAAAARAESRTSASSRGRHRSATRRFRSRSCSSRFRNTRP